MPALQAAGGAPLSEPGPTTSTGWTGAAPPQPVRPRRVGTLLGVALGVLVLDVATKAMAVAWLADRPVELLGGWLTLTEVRNTGAAFGVAGGATVLLTLVAAVVIAAIVRTSRRLRSLPWALSLGMVLGGAVGNLLDRLLRDPAPLRGGVVDWIQVPHWPVFNLADSAIVVGGALAVLLAARGHELDGTVRRGS